MTDLIALASACGALSFTDEDDAAKDRIVFTLSQLAAFAARIAPPEAKTIDIERMLRDCVPGGSVCDPQQVADSIRAWIEAQSIIAGLEPPGCPTPGACSCPLPAAGAPFSIAELRVVREEVEAALAPAPAAPDVPTEALRKALELAVRQNSHDMLMTGEEIRKCEAALATEQAAPVQAVPEGMVLVPKRSTEAMLQAGRLARSSGEPIAGVYDAMIDAALSASQGGGAS